MQVSCAFALQHDSGLMHVLASVTQHVVSDLQTADAPLQAASLHAEHSNTEPSSPQLSPSKRHSGAVVQSDDSDPYTISPPKKPRIVNHSLMLPHGSNDPAAVLASEATIIAAGKQQLRPIDGREQAGHQQCMASDIAAAGPHRHALAQQQQQYWQQHQCWPQQHQRLPSKQPPASHDVELQAACDAYAAALQSSRQPNMQGHSTLQQQQQHLCDQQQALAAYQAALGRPAAWTVAQAHLQQPQAEPQVKGHIKQDQVQAGQLPQQLPGHLPQQLHEQLPEQVAKRLGLALPCTITQAQSIYKAFQWQKDAIDFADACNKHLAKPASPPSTAEGVIGQLSTLTLSSNGLG